jgi:hypothetical protein
MRTRSTTVGSKRGLLQNQRRIISAASRLGRSAEYVARNVGFAMLIV